MCQALLWPLGLGTRKLYPQSNQAFGFISHKC